MTKAGAIIGVLTCAAACAWGSPGSAQQQDSLLKNAAKALGFATDVGPPADFVQKSRPKGDLDYIPLFQPPPEPARPAMNVKDLAKLRSDLDSIDKRDDTTREAFPPSAKAVAEEKAERAKAAAKKPNPQQ